MLNLHKEPITRRDYKLNKKHQRHACHNGFATKEDGRYNIFLEEDNYYYRVPNVDALTRNIIMFI